jgi:predicted phosphodiesterase
MSAQFKPKFVEGSLPLIKGRETKFVFISDVHWPDNVKLKHVFSFIKTFKPDYVLAVGDILNGDPFSPWERGTPHAFKQMPDPKQYYYESTQELYKPLREAAGDAKIVHWIGNHEFWAQRAVMQFPEGQGYWEIWNNVSSEYVDMWVPSKKLANLGKLHFMHGDFAASKDCHAKRFLTLFMRNLRYGHWHDIQEAGYCSPIDQKERWTARSCGCLQNTNPHYMQNQPHNWINAFTYGVVTPNGLFWDTTVKIIDGKFWAEGKFYSNK